MLLASGFWLLGSSSEIIDRIAVTVDNQLITQSDLVREIRLTAFLNGEKLEITPEAKRKAAERLIEQTLVRNDMEQTRFPPPPESDVDRMVGQVRQSRFRSDEQFRKDLAAYGLTEADLREHLRRQAAILRYTDFRFKPEIQVSETEIRSYYDNRLVPEMRKRGVSPIPSYDEMRSDAEEGLVGERVNERVDLWLKEARTKARVRLREDAFQ